MGRSTPTSGPPTHAHPWCNAHAYNSTPTLLSTYRFDLCPSGRLRGHESPERPWCMPAACTAACTPHSRICAVLHQRTAQSCPACPGLAETKCRRRRHWTLARVRMPPQARTQASIPRLIMSMPVFPMSVPTPIQWTLTRARWDCAPQSHAVTGTQLRWPAASHC